MIANNVPLKIYEFTLLVVGTENIVMSMTLLLCMAKKCIYACNRPFLSFLGVAMLLLGIINWAEYLVGITRRIESTTLALVIFAASIQLFLFFFAYVSMLDKHFVTWKRACFEIILILLFVAPVLMVSPVEDPLLFHILFVVALCFYGVKLIINIYIYKRSLHKVTVEIENFHSKESHSLYAWINNTFYMVISVGVVSVVVPLTNYVTLVTYNSFLFFAYLYIYIVVFRNIYVFSESLAEMDKSVCRLDNMLPNSTETDSEQERTSSDALQESGDREHPSSFSQNIAVREADDFMFGRKRFYDAWIARRAYANPGVTVDDIATELHTNRTRFSTYLKNELHMNYYEWIALLRVEDAKKQLTEHPEIPICEIAVNVGIEDKSNFGRTFKKFVGVSPVTYRKEHLLHTHNNPGTDTRHTNK